MDYHVEIKNIEPIRVAYMRYEGDIGDAKKYFPKVLRSIHGRKAGDPLFHFQNAKKQTKIELCVPTNRTPKTSGIEVKELPGIKAACITYIGSHEVANIAYQILKNFAEDQQLELAFRNFREVYIKGPGMILRGNPNNYITEIQIPIKGEQW